LPDPQKLLKGSGKRVAHPLPGLQRVGILVLAFFPKNLNTYKASGGIEIRNSKAHPLSAADKGWGTQNIPGASSVGHPANYLILVSANSLFLAATGQGQKQRPRRPA